MLPAAGGRRKVVLFSTLGFGRNRRRSHSSALKPDAHGTPPRARLRPCRGLCWYAPPLRTETRLWACSDRSARPSLPRQSQESHAAEAALDSALIASATSPLHWPHRLDLVVKLHEHIHGCSQQPFHYANPTAAAFGSTGQTHRTALCISKLYARQPAWEHLSRDSTAQPRVLSGTSRSPWTRVRSPSANAPVGILYDASRGDLPTCLASTSAPSSPGMLTFHAVYRHDRRLLRTLQASPCTVAMAKAMRHCGHYSPRAWLPRRCTEKPHLNDLPARGYSALDMAGAVCAADLLSSSVRDRRACSCASSRSLPRALGLRPAYADLVLTDILPLSTCYLPPAPQARAGLNPYPFSTIPSNGAVG